MSSLAEECRDLWADVPSPPQVLQYKKRCGELEQNLAEKAAELDQQRLSVSLAGRERSHPRLVSVTGDMHGSAHDWCASARSPFSAIRAAVDCCNDAHVYVFHVGRRRIALNSRAF